MKAEKVEVTLQHRSLVELIVFVTIIICQASEGESVAGDVITSTPELLAGTLPSATTTSQGGVVGPPSPINHQGGLLSLTNAPAPPSPDSTPRLYPCHIVTPAEEEGRGNRPIQEDQKVFDGGGAFTIGTTASVIRPISSLRSASPPTGRPSPPFSPTSQPPPRPHSSPGRPATASSPRLSPVIRHAPLAAAVAAAAAAPPRGVIISQSQQQLWLKHSRINGVKPELIGGSFPPASPVGATVSQSPGSSPLHRSGSMSHHHHHQPSPSGVRSTPTVIMGEAGGVRTMIWSQPSLIPGPASPQQQDHATTSWQAAAAVAAAAAQVGVDETAAQLLLNLGQDRLRLPVTSTTMVNTGNSNGGGSSSSGGRPSPHSPVSYSPSTGGGATTGGGGSPLNMERLWAGDLRQLPGAAAIAAAAGNSQQLHALNLSAPTAAAAALLGYTPMDVKPLLDPAGVDPQSTSGADEEEQPMICMICEDKATGLHYGIITCEGCKGFFKRTVQNRRVYTCVADGNCEITKAQRNRCQYCRFKKCIEQGMVLQAVREDRMPGGRNSGAVYNLYKVKYKKHKKPSAKQQPQKASEKAILAHQLKQQQQQMDPSGAAGMGSLPSSLVNGTILKTALTNPSEVIRLRQRLDSATVTSSRDRSFSVEYSMAMIKTLIDCDEFQDIATLQNLDDLLDHNTDLSEKLCNIGDSIVYKLVQWTKRLPFYLELPVEVHTRLLTHKWHELLVLTTSAYQAIHKHQPQQQNREHQSTVLEADFNQEVETNLCTLQSCLTSMMGREITIEQLRQDVGLMIEKITHVTLMFRQIKLTMEEYVCLKVITMLNQAKPSSTSGNSELEAIHERYMTCLRVYTQHMYPQQITRFQDLLVRLPEIQSAASLLLESKMFYVPFLLNSAIQR
ncbi:unnamed protein product [Acanthoscelides obtectus]|uniref:Hormone receptor 4 n=1 Tax=Acanthoscelides obtectus TaxID=200917 RepID=A0A9P0KJ44_ACAOB|nr:unnamed protein product [Acanthoscelides obtectus]CAK1651990.1 Hormone receptor 4 [Acanthoscelides obtectus]